MIRPRRGKTLSPYLGKPAERTLTTLGKDLLESIMKTKNWLSDPKTRGLSHRGWFAPKQRWDYQATVELKEFLLHRQADLGKSSRNSEGPSAPITCASS